jgi:biopolymer transport protein ExbD
MNLPKDPDIPPQINIVSLIEVMFWLLTFFIISSLFLSKPEGLPVNLPKATSSQPTQTTNRVTITIDSKGQVSLDRQPTTVEALPAQLTALAATRQDLIAAINSDESVDFGLAVAVMDRVRQVKGVEYPIVSPSIEVPHSWVPTTFLASKDAWSALDNGALLRSSEILGGGAAARNAKIAFGGPR